MSKPDDSAGLAGPVFQTIGVIEMPFSEPAETPIQPSRSEGAQGRVHVYEPFREGVRDLEGFERIWLVYWLLKVDSAQLLVTPFLDTQQRGVFATRGTVWTHASLTKKSPHVRRSRKLV